jgi:hypothetical protein
MTSSRGQLSYRVEHDISKEGNTRIGISETSLLQTHWHPPGFGFSNFHSYCSVSGSGESLRLAMVLSLRGNPEPFGAIGENYGTCRYSLSEDLGLEWLSGLFTW